MATLLYHSTQAGTPGVSPFDEAVLQVANSGAVRIVSPYIGVAYLERIIAVSSEWRLISDVQEWLGSLPRQALPRAWQFIREHLDLIHHYPALHAKAVISDSLAMMGSANLTNPGILGRTEMGILLDDPKLVAEMGSWFDALWASTAPPMVDETSAYIQWLDKEASHAPARRQRFVLSSHSHKIRARLVKLDLGAPAIRDEQAPLDLGAVAQARIVQDQRHYDTLGLALDAALDQCAGRGDFSLGDFIAEVRRGFSGAATREVYFLLLQHCACHARTVFVESTRNRLILANGRFTQSSREALVPALAPFDTFLAHLVGSLEFHQARGLPDEDRLERETGMNWQDQGTLVAALLDCGLLGLEDAPGELPHYYLESDFEWTGRYALFSRAHAAWVAKQRQAPRADAGLDPIEDFEGEFAGDASDDEYGVLSGDQLPEILEDSEDSIDFAGIDKALRESASSDYIGAWQSHRAARLTERSRAQRERDRIDELLAKLLGVLARGQAFDEPDGPALIRYIAETTDTPRAVVKAALGSGAQSGYPKVFQVTRTQTGGHGLEINPSLAWGMLAGYPRAQSACNRLLGDAAT